MPTLPDPVSSDPICLHGGSVEEVLPWIEAELARSQTSQCRALLAQYLGSIYDKVGQPRQAVSQWLAASNEITGSRESTEQLVRLIEKHQSFGNLRPLLVHACTNASIPTEVEQSQIAYAWLLINHESKLEPARDAILKALNAVPESAIAAATLEIVAHRLKDAELLERALTLRAASIQDPTLQAIVKLDLANHLAVQGRTQRAIALLETLLEHDSGPFHWEAFQLLCRLQSEARPTPSTAAASSAAPGAETLFARRTGYLSKLTNAHTNGDPLLALTLRGTVSLQSRQGYAQSAALIESRMTDLAPLAPAARLAFHAAYLRGDLETAERLASTGPGSECYGPAAASRFVQLAELRFANDREGAALAALAAAKKNDPACLIAHARHLDRLQARQDSAGYAEALESWANADAESRHAHRAWLLAADAWAGMGKQGAQARKALTSAVKCGFSTVSALRLARGYARFNGDEQWRAEATEQLLENQQLTPGQLATLRTESLQRAIVNQKPSEAADHLERLSQIPEAMFLCQLCQWFDIGTDRGNHSNALDYLARNHCSFPLGATLRWLAAIELQGQGETQTALRHLRATISTQPFHPLSAGTLSTLLQNEPTEEQTHLRTLRSFAERTDDSSLACGFLLEAGLREYWRGNFAASIGDFSKSVQLGSQAASLLLKWTNPAGTAPAPSLAAPDSNGLAPNEQLLQSLQALCTDTSVDPEHFEAVEEILRLGGSNDKIDVGIRAAANLLLLLHELHTSTTAEQNAYTRLVDSGPEYGELAACLSFLHKHQDSLCSTEELEQSARQWAHQSKQLVAQLAWLSASQVHGGTENSLEALASATEIASSESSPYLRSAKNIRLHALGQQPVISRHRGDTLLQLSDFEVTPPGSCSAQRLEVLQSAASLFDEDTAALAALLRGYHHLAEGQLQEAGSAFQQYATAFPQDPAGWEGLISSAASISQEQLKAAVQRIASSCSEAAFAAPLLAKAAETFRVRWLDDTSALNALRESVRLDSHCESSLLSLQALLTEPNQQQELLDVTERALKATTDPKYRVQLTWTQARTLRKLNQPELALAAAEHVVTQDPSHSAAYALLGEVYLVQGKYEQAIERLTFLAKLTSAPSDQRLTSGLAAVDLLEDKLNATERSLQVLLSLHRGGLGTLAVRERIARAAVKLEAWEEAVVVLEQLMFERETQAEQVEAARMALAIHRDRLQAPRSAGHAAEVLLKLLPGDPEAIDLVASGHLDPMLTRELLTSAQNTLTARLATGQAESTTLELVAAIAKRTTNQGLLQKTLGSLLVLGHDRSTYLAELEILEQSAQKCPKAECDNCGLSQLLAPHKETGVDRLFRHLAQPLIATFLPSAQSLGAIQEQQIDLNVASPLVTEVQRWATALGVASFKLYTSTSTPTRIVVSEAETIIIVVGFKVTAPLGPAHRQQLAVGLLAHKTRFAWLLHQGEQRTTEILFELSRLAAIECEPSFTAVSRAVEKQLRRALPRKLRKSLPEWAFGLQDFDPLRWVSQGLFLFDKIAALASGDPSWALAETHSQQRLTTTPAPSNLKRIELLIQYLYSSPYDSIRNSWELGPHD